MVYEINKTCATKLEGLQFGVRYVISLGFEYDNFFFFTTGIPTCASGSVCWMVSAISPALPPM